MFIPEARFGGRIILKSIEGKLFARLYTTIGLLNSSSQDPVADMSSYVYKIRWKPVMIQCAWQENYRTEILKYTLKGSSHGNAMYGLCQRLLCVLKLIDMGQQSRCTFLESKDPMSVFQKRKKCIMPSGKAVCLICKWVCWYSHKVTVINTFLGQDSKWASPEHNLSLEHMR